MLEELISWTYEELITTNMFMMTTGTLLHPSVHRYCLPLTLPQSGKEAQNFSHRLLSSPFKEQARDSIKAFEWFCGQWLYLITDVSHMHEKVHVTTAKSPTTQGSLRTMGSALGQPEKRAMILSGRARAWAQLSLIAWLSSLRYSWVTLG